MAYVDPNYPSKKDFKTAVAAGKQHYPYNAGGMYPVTQNGRVSIEGPHYPKPHKWYADCDVKDGVITKVR
jgi:hypothetical protein